MTTIDAERGVLAMFWLLTLYAQKWITEADAQLRALEQSDGTG